jgi:hypothetical protein
MERRGDPSVGSVIAAPRETGILILKKILLCLLSIIVSASFVSAQDWFKGTLDEAFAKAKAENKRVLVDFSSYS